MIVMVLNQGPVSLTDAKNTVMKDSCKGWHPRRTDVTYSDRVKTFMDGIRYSDDAFVGNCLFQVGQFLPVAYEKKILTDQTGRQTLLSLLESVEGPGHDDE